MTSVVNEPAVTTIQQALGVARAVQAAEPEVPVGRLLDAIAIFLKERLCPALRRDEREIHEILAFIGRERAVTVVGWLARRAGDWDTFLFWERVEDRHRRLLAADAEPLVF